MNNDIQSLLDYDALKVAEDITKGTHHHPADLALLLTIDNTRKKEKALKAIGDTYGFIPFEDTCEILKEEGFRLVLDEPFAFTRWEPQDDAIRIWFNPAEGSLFVHTKYDRLAGQKPAINNAAHLYFCWQPKDEKSRRARAEVRVSGFDSLNADFGHFDAREGFRHKLNTLRENGTFITPWTKNPNQEEVFRRLWLVTHQDEFLVEKEFGEDWSRRSARYDQISQERFGRLPDFVRTAIGA